MRIARRSKLRIGGNANYLSRRSWCARMKHRRNPRIVPRFAGAVALTWRTRAGAVRHHEEFELRGTPIGGMPSYPVLQVLVRWHDEEFELVGTRIRRKIGNWELEGTRIGGQEWRASMKNSNVGLQRDSYFISSWIWCASMGKEN